MVHWRPVLPLPSAPRLQSGVWKQASASDACQEVS